MTSSCRSVLTLHQPQIFFSKDVGITILSFLPSTDILRCQFVSKIFYHAASSQRLWRVVALREFGFHTCLIPLCKDPQQQHKEKEDDAESCNDYQSTSAENASECPHHSIDINKVVDWKLYFQRLQSSQYANFLRSQRRAQVTLRSLIQNTVTSSKKNDFLHYDLNDTLVHLTFSLELGESSFGKEYYWPLSIRHTTPYVILLTVEKDAFTLPSDWRLLKFHIESLSVWAELATVDDDGTRHMVSRCMVYRHANPFTTTLREYLPERRGSSYDPQPRDGMDYFVNSPLVKKDGDLKVYFLQCSYQDAGFSAPLIHCSPTPASRLNCSRRLTTGLTPSPTGLTSKEISPKDDEGQKRFFEFEEGDNFFDLDSHATSCSSDKSLDKSGSGKDTVEVGVEQKVYPGDESEKDDDVNGRHTIPLSTNETITTPSESNISPGEDEDILSLMLPGRSSLSAFPSYEKIGFEIRLRTNLLVKLLSSCSNNNFSVQALGNSNKMCLPPVQRLPLQLHMEMTTHGQCSCARTQNTAAGGDSSHPVSTHPINYHQRNLHSSCSPCGQSSDQKSSTDGKSSTSSASGTTTSSFSRFRRHWGHCQHQLPYPTDTDVLRCPYCWTADLHTDLFPAVNCTNATRHSRRVFQGDRIVLETQGKRKTNRSLTGLADEFTDGELLLPPRALEEGMSASLCVTDAQGFVLFSTTCSFPPKRASRSTAGGSTSSDEQERQLSKGNQNLVTPPVLLWFSESFVSDVVVPTRLHDYLSSVISLQINNSHSTCENTPSQGHEVSSCNTIRKVRLNLNRLEMKAFLEKSDLDILTLSNRKKPMKPPSAPSCRRTAIASPGRPSDRTFPPPPCSGRQLPIPREVPRGRRQQPWASRQKPPPLFPPQYTTTTYYHGRWQRNDNTRGMTMSSSALPRNVFSPEEVYLWPLVVPSDSMEGVPPPVCLPPHQFPFLVFPGANLQQNFLSPPSCRRSVSPRRRGRRGLPPSRHVPRNRSSYGNSYHPPRRNNIPVTLC